MSSDLEPRQQNPNPPPPMANLRVDTSTSSSAQHETRGAIEIALPQQRRSSGEDDGHDSSSKRECWTPTSSEHRIPAALACPPAPRKPRAVPSRKRPSSFVPAEFFDQTHRDEVEEFFRSCEAAAWRDRKEEQQGRRVVVKRRCLSKDVVVKIL